MTDSAEKNNERYVPKRKERPTNYVAQDTCSSRNEVQASGGGDNNRDNRNINKEDGVSIMNPCMNSMLLR